MKAALLTAALVLWTGIAGAAEPQAADERQYADAPPPSATMPLPEPGIRMAANPDGLLLEVRPLDDPGNPYAGRYSDYDRWFYSHYVPEVTDEEAKHFGG
jgi:hypothetical protein